LAQDYPNLRIVVFDNGSSDGTPASLAERLRNEPRVRLILSPVNRGVVYPMNEVWFGESAGFPEGGGAELLAKVDNDTLVPPDLLRRLAEAHMAGDRFGALAGFHFREEGAALIDDCRIEEIDGVRVVRQRFVGGCAVMVKKVTLDRLGPIPCRTEGQAGPFMDGGWTAYQERMTAAGLVSGYVWPLVHVDHMEDVRSPHCIRTAEHQAYKQALRDMTLEQFTEALCVWKPHWEGEKRGTRNAECGPAGSGADLMPSSPLLSAIAVAEPDSRVPLSGLDDASVRPPELLRIPLHPSPLTSHDSPRCISSRTSEAISSSSIFAASLSHSSVSATANGQSAWVRPSRRKTAGPMAVVRRSSLPS
jgi:hypothetical protein